MAVDVFIKIKGVEGESQDERHKGEIDVLSWSWGMSQGAKFGAGGGGGAAKVSIQDLSLTKYVDCASNALMLACCKGTHIAEATLVVRKAGDKPLEYIKLVLSNVLVSSLSNGGSAGQERPTESVALNFEQYRFEYVTQTAAGAGLGARTAGWNLSTNSAVG